MISGGIEREGWHIIFNSEMRVRNLKPGINEDFPIIGKDLLIFT